MPSPMASKIVKKIRVASALDKAAADGSMVNCARIAKAFGVNPSYVQRMAVAFGYSRYVERVPNRASQRSRLVKVMGWKHKNSKNPCPNLRIPCEVIRGAGFEIGEELFMKAEKGRIVIVAKGEME